MEYLLEPAAWAAFGTLAILEIVLGIDNVVFIAILTGKLPKERQAFARRLGLGLAAAGRIVLLFCITWVITLEDTVVVELPFEIGSSTHAAAEPPGDGADAHTGPLAQADEMHADDAEDAASGGGGTPLSAKDLILIVGGLFLLGKATWEFHHSLEGAGHAHATGKAAVAKASFGVVISQIILLDLVFSIDSVLTAIGMVRPEDYVDAGMFPGTSVPWPPLVIMIAAILLAIAVMLIFVGPISRFIRDHPALKMLALSFLLLIGLVLIAEGLHFHIPRGYIYFGMGFALFVELLNLKITGRKHKKQPPPGNPGDPRDHPLQEGSVQV
jgi:predicted tellurium resistance membrane protein TerC